MSDPGTPCRDCRGTGTIPDPYRDPDRFRLAEIDCRTCAGTGWAVRPR
jgi:DnaJ-class molecular chaperone